MTIRVRLWLTFFVILALFAIDIVIYRHGNAQRSESFAQVNRVRERQRLVSDVEQALRDQRAAVETLLLVADAGTPVEPDEVAELTARLARIGDRIAEIEALSAPLERPLAASLAQHYERLRREWIARLAVSVAPEPETPASGPPGSEAPASGPPASEAPPAETPAPGADPASPLIPPAPPEPAVDPYRLVTNRLEELDIRERQLMAEATENFDAVARRTDRFILGIFFFSALVASAVALLVSIHLQRGLRALKTGARKIGSGDLEHRIAIGGQDELAELGAAFDRMAENLQTARTRVEEARAAAEEANRAKSTFLANMSHELRTPMNAILGYSEMLAEDAEQLGQEALLPDLRKILAAGKHLLTLIDDVLDLSKIEAGKMTLLVEEVALDVLIDDVATTIEPLAAKNRNRLAIEADEPGTMRADEAKLRQTLLNLLSNACKFTTDGTITLRVERQAENGDGRVRFRISDTGIGMTEEQASRVFDEFVQADSSTTRRFGGTGLGLAISKQFCRLMGGDITVASEPGEGTTFVVDLPAVVPDAAAPAAPDAADAGPGATEAEPDAVDAGPDADGCSVLVIDDDRAARELTRRALEREGLAVATASNGAQGLVMARQLRPRAVILDVMMPGMNGWVVLDALKRDPATAGIPVIMLSMLHEREVGYALGASEYLSKPVERRRLAAYVEKYLGSSRAGTGSVLIVDDEAEVRRSLRLGLERAGWIIDEAENGLVALARMTESVPDLILLDLAMPQMDGFDFLREIRATDAWRDVPVVVVTGKTLSEAERDELAGQVEAILKKGADDRDRLLAELRALVSECVARRGRAREPGTRAAAG